MGAAYLGEDVVTCLAEVFQLTRFVDVDRDAPYVTAFSGQKELDLVDVTGGWLLSAGRSAAVGFGEKGRTQAWARAIREAWPQADGVYSLSTRDSSRNVVTLWTEDTFPQDPDFSQPLNSPAILPDIVTAAAQIGYASNVIL